MRTVIIHPSIYHVMQPTTPLISKHETKTLNYLLIQLPSSSLLLMEKTCLILSLPLHHHHIV